jgi:hypothetical protein
MAGIGLVLTLIVVRDGDSSVSASDRSLVGNVTTGQVSPPTPQEEPVKTSVAISLESRPVGAEVWREGAEAPEGVTPLTVTLNKSTEPEIFEFRLDGFRIAREEAPLDRDGRIVVALEEIPPPIEPPDKVVKRPIKMDNTKRRGSKRTAAKAGERVKAPRKAAKQSSTDYGALVDPFAQ